jgi:hypothetical protein
VEKDGVEMPRKETRQEKGLKERNTVDKKLKVFKNI